MLFSSQKKTFLSSEILPDSDLSFSGNRDIEKLFIAHVRQRDVSIQTVSQHLIEVGELAKQFASKIYLPSLGMIIGLAHDIGKYSAAFQNYIRGVTGMRGEEEKEKSNSLKGKIDHSTAGAQIIWDALNVTDHELPSTPEEVVAHFVPQILATCVAAHHSREGLFDFIAPDGQTPFLKRIGKSKDKSNVDEVQDKGDVEIFIALQQLLSPIAIFNELLPICKKIVKNETNHCLRNFHLGLLTRFLSSCLIDADRLNTANFENPKASTFRNTDNNADWLYLTDILESHLTTFKSKNKVDELRANVSNYCFKASQRPRGVFTLMVPTGGGKTLSSLRFALHHALFHSSAPDSRIERIIYVVPYTSIIEQNAGTIRSILGEDNIIEHHSNLLDVNDTWRNNILSENWDAPVVFTTSVQFLNALFAAPTGDARRMHQLANSIIIFDEIQTLPIKTVHLFNNAVNFLVQTCGSSFILCTATQPLLDKVNTGLGAIRLDANSSIIPKDLQLSKKIRRTEVKDCCKPGGWSVDEITDLSVRLMNDNGSLLIIVNTKASALLLYQKLLDTPGVKIYHLSTNMCPSHRKDILRAINEDLRPGSQQPIICISTQLIEAGVDIDFGAVIRYIAGLDSIAQAAGRCNRNGKRNIGLAPVIILNPSQENIDNLPEIRKAQEVTRRILDDFRNNPQSIGNDLLSSEAMEQFFEYYFRKRKDEMKYPVTPSKELRIPCETNLLDLLSENNIAFENYQRINNAPPPFQLRQAFSTASLAFRVIDAPTRGIIVPYGQEGKNLIGELAAAFTSSDCPLKKQRDLLRRAQQYSVNIFPHLLTKLHKKGCIYEVQEESGIYCLNEQNYNNNYGVSVEETMAMSFINI